MMHATWISLPRPAAGSRLPLLRRISQVAFLALFLGLLAFTSLRPATGSSSDIHQRAPVRLFFLLDPLVAISMLNTCSPNVCVVNIDNGLGAACIATLINRV
jgi:hypothetical protein